MADVGPVARELAPMFHREARTLLQKEALGRGGSNNDVGDTERRPSQRERQRIAEMAALMADMVLVTAGHAAGLERTSKRGAPPRRPGKAGPAWRRMARADRNRQRHPDDAKI